MTEVLFYHLERQTLEQVLPILLTKTLERGWRAVVQASSPERVEALNKHLWTFEEDSFLPHGASSDGFADAQPIWLTDGEDRPNGAEVRFFVDGANSEHVGQYQRMVHLFDGRDEDALVTARQTWKAMKAAGHEVTYWQQNARGAWERKA